MIAVAVGLTALAQSFGSVDTSFNVGQVPGADSWVQAVALQPDGKVVIGGYFEQVNGKRRSRVARLNADGSIDLSFDPGGTVSGSVNALAVQPDGKTVIGGTFGYVDGINRSGVARLNRDGSLDATFMTEQSFTWEVRSLALQPDGKLLVGGIGDGALLLTRLNSDGTSDTSFNHVFSSVSSQYPGVTAIRVQPNGKILIAGTFVNVDGRGSTGVARLNSDGTFDTTFTATITGRSPYDYPFTDTLALQSDGKVIVGGYFSAVNGTSRENIARLNADGTLDTSFGTSITGSAESISVQPNGQILIGGAFSAVNGTSRSGVVRVNAGGALDASFDTGMGGGFSTVYSLALQPDGRTIIGGVFKTVGTLPRSYVARLNSNGRADESFNPGGGLNGPVWHIQVQPDKKVVVSGGFTGAQGAMRVGVARFDSNGALDTSFIPPFDLNYRVGPIALQPDGKVLVGGDVSSGGYIQGNFVMRLNTNGTPDNGFSFNLPARNGIAAIAVQSNGQILVGGWLSRMQRLHSDGSTDTSFSPPALGDGNYLLAIEAQPDGKILIGGNFATIGGAYRPGLARLNPDGSLDSEYVPNIVGGSVFGMLLQPDGKLLALGRFGIARLTTDGTRDMTFNPPNQLISVGGCALQPDGKILICGSFTIASGPGYKNVARLNPDGSVDDTFPGTAVPNDYVSQIAYQKTGKVLIAGHFTAVSDLPSSFLARLNADPPSLALTIATQGSGTVVTSPDRPFYHDGESVTLTAMPGRWHAFTRWADGTAANPRVITIATTNNYEAIFSPTTALETLIFDGVSRTAPVGMPAVFVDGRFIADGMVTNLRSATITLQTTFTNGVISYTLTGSNLSGASRQYTNAFGLRRSATIRAIAYGSDLAQAWEADPVQVIIIPAFLLEASAAGGGTVTVSPANALHLSNTVAVTETTAAPGWSFVQWLGDAGGTNPTASVTLSRDKCVEAVFGTTLDTMVVGSGSVAVNPATAVFPYGTVARLTALPEAGHYFAFWGGTGSGTNNPLSFPVTNAQPTVTAVFQPLSGGEFALAVVADGFGSVNYSPRGNRFHGGQAVTLTALPEADQQFLSWSGDASGTQNPLSVTMDRSRVITAHFTKRPHLWFGPCRGGWSKDGFQLTLTGAFGGRYQIEESSDLLNWNTVANVTNIFGIQRVMDPFATNDAARFYRAVEAP